MLLVVFITLFSQLVNVETQTEKTGKLKGVVVDQNDAVVLTATITVTDKGRRWVLKPSVKDGRFNIELPSGSYDIQAEAYQFQTFKQKNIQVKPDSETEQKLMLKVVPSKPQKCPKGRMCL
ncbi:MAG: carboxypeptidase regulatory-like domain-containing protein [Acidobacteria bacterium]|nr:carboxypeptidase regulatory-like domain-containing protein [Acidobacteriota bacterium]